MLKWATWTFFLQLLKALSGLSSGLLRHSFLYFFLSLDQIFSCSSLNLPSNFLEFIEVFFKEKFVFDYSDVELVELTAKFASLLLVFAVYKLLYFRSEAVEWPACLPSRYYISQDHLQPAASTESPLEAETIHECLERTLDFDSRRVYVHHSSLMLKFSFDLSLSI